MNEITLKLDARTAEGKKLTKLRKSGFIPSVVYGGQDKPVMTQSSFTETFKVVKVAGRHTPVNIIVDGQKKLAIIKDIDVDPVKHIYRHIAFHTINQDDIITTEVPILLDGMGESVAERAGLVILQAIEQIGVKAKPNDLPKALTLSVIDLATEEDKITIADIKLPTGVEFSDIEQDLELVIANVYEPGALQAANEASGGEAEAETEVPVEGEEPAGTEGEATGPKTADTEEGK